MSVVSLCVLIFLQVEFRGQWQFVCVYQSVKLSQLIRILAPELVYYPNLLRQTYLCDT